MAAPRDPLEPGFEPVVVCSEDGRREVRPISGARQGAAAREFDTRAERASLVGPGQRVESELSQTLQHRRARSLGWHARQRLLADDEAVDPFDLARHHSLVLGRPYDLDRAPQASVGRRFQRPAIQRRCEQDARLAITIVEVECDDELAAAEPVDMRKSGAAAVRQQEARCVAGATAPDTIGIGAGQQTCGADRRAWFYRRVIRATTLDQTPLEELGVTAHACHCARVDVTGSATATAPAEHKIETRQHIGIARIARSASQQIALAEHGGELCTEPRLTATLRLEQQVREPRVRRQARERTTVGGDALRIVQCTEPTQQVSRTVEHRRGRGIQPGQGRGLIGAPLRKIEGERREVGLDDLGRRLRREAALRAFAPQPVAGALGDAACAARALVGGGARDSPGLQAAHAGHRIERRAAYQSRIDDRADTRQRETGLGDVGGEDHTAASGRIRLQGTRLLGGGQFAVQRQQHDRVIDLGHAPEHRERTTDLARARQEGEHVARALAQRALHGECEQPLGRFVTARQDRHRPAEVSHRHGI